MSDALDGLLVDCGLRENIDRLSMDAAAAVVEAFSKRLAVELETAFCLKQVIEFTEYLIAHGTMSWDHAISDARCQS